MNIMVDFKDIVLIFIPGFYKKEFFMVTSIKIQNYKLFKSFSLENLPNIVLISGKNNCGKTSILESVFMSLDCGNSAMFIRHLGWRGLSTFYNNAESLFAPAFYNFNLNEPIIFEYVIHSNKKKLSYKFCPSISQPIVISGQNRIDLKKKSDSDLQRKSGSGLGGVEISYGTGIKNPPEKAFLKLQVNGLSLTNTQFLVKYNEGIGAMFLASNSAYSEEDPIRYGELDRINKTKEIVNKLQILEPQLQSLSLIPMGGKPIIYGDNNIGVKIPLSLMGQGIARLLSILLAISEVKKGIVLIDELENGFHHSILPLIWQAITSYAKTNNTQIIATTHSSELISGAVEGISEELRNDFKYMRIERNQDKFKTKIYNFEDLSTALKAELEIR